MTPLLQDLIELREKYRAEMEAMELQDHSLIMTIHDLTTLINKHTEPTTNGADNGRSIADGGGL